MDGEEERGAEGGGVQAMVAYVPAMRRRLMYMPAPLEELYFLL